MEKILAKQLTSIVINCYSPDVISNAKIVLVGFVEALDLGRWPHPAIHRTTSAGDGINNKCKSDIDDLFGVITYLDEKNLNGKLPRFVAGNPELLLYSAMVQGDVAGIMNQFEQIGNSLIVMNEVTTWSLKMENEVLEGVRDTANTIFCFT